MVLKSMRKLTTNIVWLLAIIVMAGCSDKAPTSEVKKIASVEINEAKGDVKLDVFKSPTCQCCSRWVNYIDDKGFDAETHHPADINVVKRKFGIAPQYQSCHTGVSEEGYIFEGHIPTDVMQKFLAEKPKGALGLAVPGMPIGSPGMEMGDQYDDYDVILLNKDGSSSVYANIKH